ncbi:MAG: hypothetical protein ABIJ73_12800 [Pseudomonadota bacterium]
MKLRSDLTINGKLYRKGESAPKWFIYPFFLFHMGMFGLSGFFMAYASNGPDLAFLYMHGGIAITVYVIFYLAIFGLDEVRWMFINAGLGLFGIWVEIDWILSMFGKSLGDFPVWVHLTPFLYYILYTFLLRQLVLDIFGARGEPTRKRRVEMAYVGLSLLVYGGTWLATR